MACGSERDNYVVNNGPVTYYGDGGRYKTGRGGGVLNFTKQKGIGDGEHCIHAEGRWARSFHHFKRGKGTICFTLS